MPIAAGFAQSPVPEGYAIYPRSVDDRLWVGLSWQTNATGVVTATTNSSFVEVGTGLEYLEDGQWKLSQDLIELQPDGSAAALRAPQKVYFSADISSDKAITIVTRKNRVVHTHPQGLYYFSPAVGCSTRVWIDWTGMGEQISMRRRP